MFGLPHEPELAARYRREYGVPVEVGRRVVARRWSCDSERAGIITAVADNGIMVRFDGARIAARLHPVNRVRYLDEVVDVPALPVGRFLPTGKDAHGFWECDGVVYVRLGVDGERLMILTGEGRDEAVEIARACCERIGLSPDYVDPSRMSAHWWVCEWQSEESEHPWLVSRAEEGDELAFHAYTLAVC